MKKLYDGGLLIIIGFIVTAIGVTLLSIGIDHTNEDYKERQKKEEAEDMKISWVQPVIIKSHECPPPPAASTIPPEEAPKGYIIFPDIPPQQPSEPLGPPEPTPEPGKEPKKWWWPFD